MWFPACGGCVANKRETRWVCTVSHCEHCRRRHCPTWVLISSDWEFCKRFHFSTLSSHQTSEYVVLGGGGVALSIMQMSVHSEVFIKRNAGQMFLFWSCDQDAQTGHRQGSLALLSTKITPHMYWAFFVQKDLIVRPPLLCANTMFWAILPQKDGDKRSGRSGSGDFQCIVLAVQNKSSICLLCHELTA